MLLPLDQQYMTEKVQIIPTSEKFDLSAPTYDNTPAEYFEQWDGPVLDMLGDVAGKSILDVGCGTGRLLQKLKRMGANAVGIDISKRMVEKTESKSLLAFQTNMNDFAWSEPFDVIVSVLTFNYIEDKTAAFERTWSLLRPGGTFIISLDSQAEDTAMRKGKGLVAAKYFPLSEQQYCGLLRQAGYVIEMSVVLFWSDKFKDYPNSGLPIGFAIKTEKPNGGP